MRCRPQGTEFRRTLVATALAAAAVLGFGATRLQAQDAGRSVWDGVYTDAQADRGAGAYAQHCGMCHGAQLAGTGEAKPLTGPEFLSNWNGLTLGELFDRTRTTMPQQAPGSLPRDVYADALAYVLKFNGFPAGKAELDKRSEVLAGIRFDAFRSAPTGTTGDVAAVAPEAVSGPNDAPNTYASQSDFFKLPPGRVMGSSSGVAVDSRGHVWVADRCGANSCTDSPLDPILEFDAQGRFVKAFGAGRFNFPHGLFIDSRDRIWVVDNRAAGGKGAQVIAFDASGRELMALGKAGVSATGTDTFFEPNAVAVARDGTIFVADGHSQGKGVHRIVKFDAQGRFLKAWGDRGDQPGQLEVPHALALDGHGRLFVADRWNNRVQIYDLEGKLLQSWTAFSRPSGVFVDARDQLFVADSESRTPEGYGHHPGWKRGVRVGSARTGAVTTFIPDTDANPDASATSGPEGIWVDRTGVIYGAMVGQRQVMRFTPR